MDGPLSILASWKSFLPEGAVVMAKRAPSALAPVDSRIIFEAPDLDAPGARELFNKIISALNLSSEEFAVFAPTGEATRGGVNVRFTAGENDEVGTWKAAYSAKSPSSESLTTYSLTTMIMNPSTKKAAWAHLKEAVARSRRAQEQ